MLFGRDNDDEPPNIRAFNFVALLVLGRIYEHFPEPIELNGTRIVIEAALDLGADAEEADYLACLSDTVRWLETEGFIRIGDEDLGGNFLRVTLTLKGLAILNSVPKSLTTRKSLARRARDAMKAESTTMIRAVIRDLLRRAVSGGV